MVEAEMLRFGALYVVLASVCWPMRVAGQEGTKQPEVPARLRLPVDEVVLTFTVEGAHGLPINDLKAEEIRVWDNGIVPRRIVAFDELVNRPIRVGILLDTSESMQGALPENKAVAERFLGRLFRQKSDEAFVSEFGHVSKLTQSWTGDVSSLERTVEAARESTKQLGGTALFNALFQACSSSFDKIDPTATGNFILLFSDGEDNAGLTSGDEAARACQRSDTQIFAFLPSSVQDRASTGPKTLRELAAKTGGRVFLVDDSEAAIWRDLETIESEMRNQYRLVYKPANLKHDGTFHEILLQPPNRVNRVEVRSGYFAPTN
jgi:Ca-activated chloride channel homolog